MHETRLEQGPGERIRGRPWQALLVAACFGLAPFLGFLADNAGGALRPWQVLRFPATGLAVVGAAVVLLWWWRGHVAAERLALVFAAGVLATFNYRSLSLALEGAGVRTLVRLVIWLLAAAVVVALAGWLSRRPGVRRFAALAGAVLVIVPTVQLAVLEVQAAADATEPATSPAPGGFTEHPDIYYIVPDGYGRADVLADHIGHDGSAFLDELRGRGFVVPAAATANYPMTYLSMAATLDMDYVVEAGPEALTGDRSPYYHRLQGGSALHQRLRDEGYRYAHAPPGTWEGSQCSGMEDLCVEPVSRRGATAWLGEAEWALLQLTPAGTVAERLLTEWLDRPFADPAHVARTVHDAGLDGPAFVQIHMLQPHPPFLFDARCRSVPQDDHRLTDFRPEQTGEYMEALQCTNRQLLELLDAIEDDAVVVIQTDHGPGFGIRWSAPFGEWSDRLVRERFTVLSAVRLPERCRGSVPDELSGVNVFRVVVACLEGREPDLLPDRWFLSSHGTSEVRELPRLPLD